eukprot:m.36692 g.36692  ORF g.36692 m.36692 type:complete len:1137 (+) comp11042_c0_seq1:205-3615(+)
MDVPQDESGSAGPASAKEAAPEAAPGDEGVNGSDTATPAPDGEAAVPSSLAAESSPVTDAASSPPAEASSSPPPADAASSLPPAPVAVAVAGEAVPSGGSAEGFEKNTSTLSQDSLPQVSSDATTSAVPAEASSAEGAAQQPRGGKFSEGRGCFRKQEAPSPGLQVSWSIDVRAQSKQTVQMHGVDDCVRFMEEGCELIKLRGKKFLYRRFWLDHEKNRICWDSLKRNTAVRHVDIAHITGIRTGFRTANFQSLDTPDISHGQCFSLLLQGNSTLDLIAEYENTRNMWVLGLRSLIKKTETSTFESRRDQFMRRLFHDADVNQDGELSFKEVTALLKNVNANLMAKQIKERMLLFVEVEDGKAPDIENGGLNYEGFVKFYKSINTRQGIFFLCTKYSEDGSPLMTAKGLKRFLEVEQQEIDVTLESCRQLIQKLEVQSEDDSQPGLSPEGLARLLHMERYGGILAPEQLDDISHDMTQPLSHYFIASSHNTYLTQDQLRGPSSVEAYVAALKAGCRSVEVDAWDGPDGEPIVKHGYTLTSPILFKDAIAAIGQAAFEVSDMPVIISLENHCSLDQQDKMMQHLESFLGSALYSEQPSMDWETGKLPSPQDLRGRFLIKSLKCRKAEEEATDIEVDADDEAIVHDSSRKAKRPTNGSSAPAEKTSKITLAWKMSKLVGLLQSQKLKSVDTVDDLETKHYHVRSIDERKAQKLIAMGKLLPMTNNELVRVFPAASRVNSSNQDPYPFWSCGVQMVALNYQTPDLPWQLNRGMFRQNGQCGYVLKPSYLRTAELCNQDLLMPTCTSSSGRRPRTLRLTIISGQQLPKPSNHASEIIDPYVSVTIVGVPADCQEDRTRTIQNNGFNPVWSSPLVFTINYPELAIIRFAVKDDDFVSDDFVAQYCCPAQLLRPGYRHVPLEAKNGALLLLSSIFVHVQWQDGPPASPSATRKKAKKPTATPKALALSFQELPNEQANAAYTEASELHDQLLKLREEYVAKRDSFLASLPTKALDLDDGVTVLSREAEQCGGTLGLHSKKGAVVLGIDTDKVLPKEVAKAISAAEQYGEKAMSCKEGARKIGVRLELLILLVKHAEQKTPSNNRAKLIQATKNVAEFVLGIDGDTALIRDAVTLLRRDEDDA